MKVEILIAFLAIVVSAEANCFYSPSIHGPKYSKIPDHVRPLKYDLMIKSGEEALFFEGSVKIHLEVVATNQRKNFKSLIGMSKVGNNQIVLNLQRAFVEIDEKTVEYMDSTGKNVPISYISYEDEFDIVILYLSENLEIGSHGTLHLDFRSVTKSIASLGLFRDDSHRYSGKKTAHSTTPSNPSRARQMFPCFDEPEFKAKFEITVEHQADETPISNTDIVSTTISPNNQDRRITRFAETPRISTFNLALIVGYYDALEGYVEKNYHEEVRVRVYTPLGKIDQAYEALEAAINILSAVQDYLDMDFPSNKLEIVSIPDLNVPVVSNYGLITMQESNLLLTEDSPDSSRRLNKILLTQGIIEHYLDNTLNLGWWDDHWLNEGIIDYLSFMLADELYPEMEIKLNRKLDDQFKNLKIDIDEILKPKVTSTQGIDYVTISPVFKAKSASLVEMINVYIGEAFRVALCDFVRARGLRKDVQLFDLISKFEHYSLKPVSHFVKFWLELPGHPLLKAKAKKRTLVVSQCKYPATKSSASLWTLPIQVLVSNGNGREEIIEIIMKDQKMVIDLPEWFDASAKDHFLKLNPGAIGFYHALYEKDLFNRLAESLNRNQLSLIDKIEFLASSHHLMQQKLITEKDMAKILLNIRNDFDSVTVNAGLECATTSNLKSIACNTGFAYQNRPEVQEFEDKRCYHKQAHVELQSKMVELCTMSKKRN